MENMTKYELIKDLPTFKKGDIFVLLGSGLHCYSNGLMAYPRAVIDKYPNILEDWFREIKEETESQGPWEPKEDEEYYHVTSFGTIAKNKWTNDCLDAETIEIGNVFRTEEDAYEVVERLRARKVLYDDAKGFKPNWKDAEEKKWVVFYDTPCGGLYIDRNQTIVSRPGPYFATRENAEASIKSHEKEWKIYLLGSDSND